LKKYAQALDAAGRAWYDIEDLSNNSLRAYSEGFA
jgi:hypothetical protein